MAQTSPEAPRNSSPLSTLPLYPCLFLLTGTLSDYAVRPGLTHLSELGVVVLVAVAIVIATFLPLLVLYRDRRKAALMTFVFLVMFFFYVKLHSWVAGWPVIGSHRVLLILSFVFLGWAGLRVYRLRRPLRTATLLLNVVALGTLLYPLGRLGWLHVPRLLREDPVERALQAVPPLRATERPEPLPDIYYFIFDRYGSPSVMAASYGYDNSDFYTFLQQKGFYVAPQSHSNYLRTSFSLPASLNMIYLDSLAEAAGYESADWNPLHELMEDHAVGRFLKSQGYTFIHAGSWWWATRKNRHADLNLNQNAQIPLPFLRLLVDFTMLKPLGQELGIEALDLRRQQWKRERFKFERIAGIAKMPEPTFTFAHFILPHEPFVFDGDGSFLDEGEMARRSDEENYRNQVAATNEKIKALIERLLADSSTPPIILVQADEGPAPERFRVQGMRFNWRTATPAELHQKTGILSAYYLPHADTSVLYPTISPVNSFRVVFNFYFGTNLPLLLDRTFAHEDDQHPYHLFEVTELVRQSSR